MDATRPEIRKSGYKTDVYLRAVGTLYHTHLPAFHDYWNDIEDVSISRFATQLIALLEDLRLEEVIKHSRPGTGKDFTIRKHYLKHFFNTQLTTNITRSYALDELFCMIYLLLQSDSPRF
ncbi:hypothetical protein [Paracerasibacillus soli]|uniref:Uncharacterized protein n=1 Tax=Paracerasibacillus soli TaxID=480284 RepID=A0ABU5CS61_9BACI|nr:hypothetical protein [Virgibacillus soli]MDY0409171.1 hypothetical protein [Virgibacillus soli]